MIQTKFFEVSHGYGSSDQRDLDELINDWLKDNACEIIDIKFQANVSYVADSGISASEYRTCALLIYKTF